VGSDSALVIREFSATPADAGIRLDRFVAVACPELSRTRVQELINTDRVRVNGRPASKGSLHLRGGEKITVEISERPAIAARPEAIPLEVLYEDEDVIAINKPAGMTVHAGAGNVSGTLVNALLGRGLKLSQGGDRLRPGIVHRLDKETSGVILVAKNDAAHAKLGEAFQQREVRKTYLALVQGSFEEKIGRIELAIGRDPIHRTRMATPRKSWRGAAIANLHFLHAARLGFAQPRTGAWTEVRSPLPQELRDFLKQLCAAAGQPQSRIDAVLRAYL